MSTKSFVVLAAFGAAAYFIFTSQQELNVRKEALPGVASSLGLQYQADAPATSSLAQAGFPLLMKGASPVATNMMLGKLDGADVKLFDFRYSVVAAGNEIQGTESTEFHDQTAALVSTANLALPAFTLRPRTLVEQTVQRAAGEVDARYGDQIGEWVKDDRVKNALGDIARFSGLNSIQFASHPQFSQKYLLTGDDQAAVQRVFTPVLLDHLMSIEPTSLEASGSEFLLYKPTQLVNQDQLGGFFNQARDLLEILKAG